MHQQALLHMQQERLNQETQSQTAQGNLRQQAQAQIDQLCGQLNEQNAQGQAAQQHSQSLHHEFQSQVQAQALSHAQQLETMRQNSFREAQVFRE